MAVDLSELNVMTDNSSMTVKGADGELMYYRKPRTLPDSESPLREAGWIDIGEANDKEMVRMMRNKGYTPLHKYGRFNHAERGFSVVQNKYLKILTHPSGTGPSEFPLSQIVELRWHVTPPYGLNVTFPQLQNADIQHEQCAICRKGFWALSEDEVKLQLHNHQRVQHRDESQNARLGEMLAKAQKDVQGPLAEVLAALVQGQQQQARILDALTTKLLGEAKQK